MAAATPSLPPDYTVAAADVPRVVAAAALAAVVDSSLPTPTSCPAHRSVLAAPGTALPSPREKHDHPHVNRAVLCALGLLPLSAIRRRSGSRVHDPPPSPGIRHSQRAEQRKLLPDTTVRGVEEELGCNLSASRSGDPEGGESTDSLMTSIVSPRVAGTADDRGCRGLDSQRDYGESPTVDSVQLDGRQSFGNTSTNTTEEQLMDDGESLALYRGIKTAAIADQEEGGDDRLDEEDEVFSEHLISPFGERNMSLAHNASRLDESIRSVQCDDEDGLSGDQRDHTASLESDFLEDASTGSSGSRTIEIDSYLAPKVSTAQSTLLRTLDDTHFNSFADVEARILRDLLVAQSEVARDRERLNAAQVAVEHARSSSLQISAELRSFSLT
jgi:hypothetical protein